jgi:hypothetical protein
MVELACLLALQSILMQFYRLSNSL